ncbi:hypothetical protein DMUE_3839 [Dictyocoela muelleri]|nr:hypothetical protein DMUE_3839 [Dictyocoela muelleri]
MEINMRADTTAERSRDIIHRVLHDFNESDLFFTPQIESLTDKIKRIRNKKHNNTISCQSDIPSSIRYLKTGDLFLQYDSGIDDDNRVVVFCTEKNLARLESSKIILMDGTFKSSPVRFKQLYTIVVYINGKYIPLLFILMRSKNEVSYSKICTFIKSKSPNFSPEYIILDFEVAPRKSFAKFFPKSKFGGCLFHFSQNIWRKIQELDLVTEYNKVYEFKKSIRCLLSLSFVRSDKVKEYFTKIIESISTENKYLYRNIFFYFEKNYINISNENLYFWNTYDRTIKTIPRTTNSLEGWHRGLNNLFTRASPDLGLFGEKLQKEYDISQKKLINAICSNSTSATMTKKELKEKELEYLVLKFEDYEPMDYLTALSLIFKWPI